MKKAALLCFNLMLAFSLWACGSDIAANDETSAQTPLALENTEAPESTKVSVSVSPSEEETVDSGDSGEQAGSGL
ncbi:MAG: hypothetical protein K2I53_01215 [Lachnospiraceae bacterium]|nr:hypothetical protein [Lachnospiraceae bacterium]